MFKKLRNRFLLLNLVTISVMMLLAFSSIYVITYRNIRSDIDMELRRISEFSRKSGDGLDLLPRPERSLSFTVITDNQWNIKVVSSVFDMDKDFYEAAKTSALSRKAATGNFKLQGAYWTFMVWSQGQGYRMVFLDITSQHGILTNLIYTFLMAAFVMLFIIYFISRLFANRAIRPVKEAFDKQKQFIADASHELKTPLAVINTNADVLLSNGEDSISNQAKWLHYIKSEAERMAKLTNDLLYLTQLDYSEVKMIFTDFDLSEKVENVILAMEAVVFERNIALDYTIEPGLIIHGNSEQIQQVVMILLDNAVKYTNNAGSINISLKRNHANVLLSVSNSGEGIAPEHIGRIFDRFYRTDKSRARKSGGYGLGLAIAKTIVEQNGGKIHVKSILNERTTFTVELSHASN